MARYNPPQTIEVPWERIVLRADPDFYKDKAKQPEYEFTKKTFRADPETRGIYGIPYDTTDPEFADAAHSDNGFTD